MTTTRRRLSEHFTIEEFDCHDGTHVPADAIAGLELAIEWWLEPMRRVFGPINVMSGYRTETYNAKIGGATNSAHIYTRDRSLANHGGERRIRVVAFDVTPAKGDVPAWVKWAHSHRARSAHLGKKGRGGIGLYPQLGFTHLDTWDKRDWTG